MKIIYNKKEFDIDEKKIRTIKALLKSLDIIPSTIVALKNGDIVNLKTYFKEGDNVEILRVISGG